MKGDFDMFHTGVRDAYLMFECVCIEEFPQREQNIKIHSVDKFSMYQKRNIYI